MRIGLLFKKLGCTSIYGDFGKCVHVTLLGLQSSVVISRDDLGNGNIAVRVGFCLTKESRLTKPMLGIYKKTGTLPHRFIRQFCVPGVISDVSVGDKFDLSSFSVGQFVDVQGFSIGKGFSGVMKRHNFPGLSASHGVSLAHRSQGSTGACQDPGKVWKGKKMAGRQGGGRVTVKNLSVEMLEMQENIMAVKGAVPGHSGSYLLVSDAISKQGGNSLVECSMSVVGA